MKPAHLRTWIKRYGNGGVLMVAAYLGLRHSVRERLILSGLLTCGALTPMFAAHRPHQIMSKEVELSSSSVALVKQSAVQQGNDNRQLRETPCRQPNSLIAELKSQGITVVPEADGQSYGLVASVPEEQYRHYSGLLVKARIRFFGGFNRRRCGFYVYVYDFYRASEVLRQHSSHGEWIWRRTPIPISRYGL